MAKRQVRELGFFREFDFGDEYPSLRSALGSSPQPEQAHLVEYLQAGKLWWASPGLVDDVIAPANKGIGTLSIRTDGVYAWPEALAYYVERYGVCLPQAFVDHARGCGWQIPVDLDTQSLKW